LTICLTFSRSFERSRGAAQIVVAAVGLTDIAGLAAWFRLQQRGIALGVEQIVFAHVDAKAEQGGDGSQRWRAAGAGP